MEIKNICPICGSPLQEEKDRLKCRYCGYSKVAEASAEETSLLYVAFQKLRMADFDESRDLFEDIARHFPRSSEAQWGMLLSDYGIKYEDDYDGKKIPTCYAARYESLYDSPLFKKAIEKADDEQKEYFKSQASRIEATRKEWIEKAEKEPPYDVFISFKDTEDGQRTSDSYDAHEIYNILTGLGYRVFFSRVTLAGKTGENYEPYIFSALNSAPVMLIFASKPEYVTSTWVKNEWNRYLARIRQKEKADGSICVIFKDFSPSLLPSVLRNKQNMKYGELTFLENLKAYVDKYVSEARSQTPSIERKTIAVAEKKGQKSIEAVKVEMASSLAKKTKTIKAEEISKRKVGSSSVAALSASEENKISQAEVYISMGDFAKASTYYEDVLSTNPHSPKALLGCLLCDKKCASLEQWCVTASPSDLPKALEVVNHSKQDVACTILEGYAKRCVDFVEKQEYGEALQIYEAIARYDVPAINKMHSQVFIAASKRVADGGSLPLIKATFPYLSADQSAFQSALAKLVSESVNQGAFEKAEEFSQEYAKYFDFTAETYLASLFAKNKVKSIGELLKQYADKEDFSSLSGELPLSEKEIDNLFGQVASAALMLVESDPSRANLIVRFLLPYRFSNRDEFIEKGIQQCCQNPTEKKAKVLDGFLHAYGDESFDKFIDAQKRFAEVCAAKEEYSLALHYFDRIIEYDPDNPFHYRQRIFVKIGVASTSLSMRIHKLQDFSDIETLISMRGDTPVNLVLRDFLDACVNSPYASETAPVFDSLCSYFPPEENKELANWLKTFAHECFRQKLYEQAEKYFTTLVSLVPGDHGSYWMILCCKLQCKDDDALIHQMTPIGDFVEFENAKLATGSDRNALAHYIKVEDSQRKWIAAENARLAKEEEERRKAEAEAAKKRRIEKAKRTRKRVLVGTISSLAAAGITVAALAFLVFIPQNKLNSGIADVKNGNYDAAISALSGVSYGESKNLLSMAYAGKAFQGGDYETGIDRVLEAGGETHVTYSTTGNGKVEKSEETIKPKAKYIDNKPAAGYEVGEWTIDSFKINIDGGYSADLTLKASTGLITYSIQYDLDGGSFASTAPSSYTVEDSFTLPIPTKEGYGFTGWVDGSWEEISSIPAGTTGDLSLTATWSASLNALTVTSSDETKGTVSIISGSGYSDESVTVLATPKEDCLFKGWYHEDDLLSDDAQYTFTMPLEDYSLTALFWTNAEQKADDDAKKAAHGIIPDLSSDGKYVTYGMYPQERVTDASLISELNLTADYNYDTTGWYILNDEFYCKVYSDWYMVQPIKWRILERSGNEAYVISDMLLDVQRYDDSSNNYANSEVREWLNGNFYSSAFAHGSEYALTTDVDNSAATTDSSSNEYACANTQDKVFLLSYQDYNNASYGFTDDASRQSELTDYAIAKKATKGESGNTGYAFTRSPSSKTKLRAWCIQPDGQLYYSFTSFEGCGVRPAMRLALTEEGMRAARGIVPGVSDDGKYITYGMYPQKKVSDEALVYKLNHLVYPDSTTGWYLLDNEYYCELSNNWYAVQPIKWKVLESSVDELFVVSDLLLDGHRYDDLSNNYKESEIRDWLNGEFYSSAFVLGNKHILTTEVNNSAATTESSSNIYACENTRDKVFLPSYGDYRNDLYGLSTAASRRCKLTDYATAKGTFTYDGYGLYWTRSPFSDSSDGAKYVYEDGNLREGRVKYNYGVRPAIRISLAGEEIRWNRAHGVEPVLSADNNYVTYGMYPQDKVSNDSLITKLNGLDSPDAATGWYLFDDEYYCKLLDEWYAVQPIKWEVWRKEGDELVVVSNMLLDGHRYDDLSNNYKGSEIRAWLNGTFFETAFALGDERVLTTEVDNSAATTDSPSNPNVCENTQDKVFLTSYQDYQATSNFQCKPTDFAVAKGVNKDSNGSGCYWTRSPISTLSNFVWSIDYGGCLGPFGSVDYDCYGVRPSLRITIA